MEYSRIVTHTDFDGIVSGALISHIYRVHNFYFCAPSDIEDRRIPIDEKDIICDLPWSSGCGRWYDHHAGNLEFLGVLGVDPASVSGAFDPAPSCARVIFDTYREKIVFPAHFEETVVEADRIDSFDFESIEAWRKPSPAHTVELAIKSFREVEGNKFDFLQRLVMLVGKFPLSEVAKDEKVQKLAADFTKEEEKMLVLLPKVLRPAKDCNELILVIDLTSLKHRPKMVRNLAFVLYPKAHVVVEFRCLFEGYTKTNNLGIGASLSPAAPKNVYDLGLIFRDMNLGGGHPGAAGGKVLTKTRRHMNAAKASDEVTVVKRLVDQLEKSGKGTH